MTTWYLSHADPLPAAPPKTLAHRASTPAIHHERTHPGRSPGVPEDERPVSSGDSDNRRSEAPRDLDLPPRPKKWDFPRFDGTTDPLLFLNKFDSYFRHHRTMNEERVGMASYHLDDVA